MQLFNLIFLLFFFTVLNGQQDSVPKEGVSSIIQLKEGVLVVRLDMKENVIKAYEKILDNSTDQKQLARIQERLDNLISERELYKENVIKALTESYTFSDYCLVDNNKMGDFLNGDYTVLNCNAKKFDSYPYYFFLIKGKRDSHWIFKDSEFRKVLQPFPESHDLGIKNIFDFFVGEDNFSMENMNRVFSKMDKRLEKYYENEIQKKP